MLHLFRIVSGATVAWIVTLSGIPGIAMASGVWMVRIKKAFGLVMLGVAEYYLIKMGQVLI